MECGKQTETMSMECGKQMETMSMEYETMEYEVKLKDKALLLKYRK